MPDLEIREQIARYAAGEIDAEALEDVLEEASWSEEYPAGSLVHDALRLLHERANGDWTDDELRVSLTGLSRTYQFEQSPPAAYADSDSHVIREDRRSASVERLRVAESV